MRAGERKPRPKKAAPTVDFDLDSSMAGLHTLALLCWPDDQDQEQRVIAARNWLRRCYENRMVEIAEKALLHLLDENTAKDLGEAIEMLNVSVDPEQFFAPFALAGEQGRKGAEDGFCQFLGVAPGTHRLRPAPQWWQSSPFKTGDLPEDLPEYAFANALDSAVVEPPMLAGLGLLLAAAADAPCGRVGSLNAAWKFFSENRLLGQTWDITSLVRMWSDWCPMAPLWAGVLTEARCWEDGIWHDFAKLETSIIQAVSLQTRRDRVYAYAKWFVTDVAPKKAVGSRAALIANDKIIRLPDAVIAAKPDLSGVQLRN